MLTILFSPQCIDILHLSLVGVNGGGPQYPLSGDTFPGHRREGARVRAQRHALGQCAYEAHQSTLTGLLSGRSGHRSEMWGRQSGHHWLHALQARQRSAWNLLYTLRVGVLTKAPFVNSPSEIFLVLRNYNLIYASNHVHIWLVLLWRHQPNMNMIFNW